MKNSMRKPGSTERLGNSLKIATFVAVAGFVTLAATSHLTMSAPGEVTFGDGVYTSTLPDTQSSTSSPAPATVATKPADYFPSQFEIKADAADPSVPTF